jgi:hypothetical protein
MYTEAFFDGYPSLTVIMASLSSAKLVKDKIIKPFMETKKV